MQRRLRRHKARPNLKRFKAIHRSLARQLATMYLVFIQRSHLIFLFLKQKNQDTVTVQAFYLSNPHKLMDIRQSGPLLKAAAHTGQCTLLHLHKSHFPFYESGRSKTSPNIGPSRCASIDLCKWVGVHWPVWAAAFKRVRFV